MSYSSISARVTINGTSDPAMVAQLEDLLRTIYEGSTLAAAKIDAWLAANPLLNLTITYQANAAGTIAATGGSGHIVFDPSAGTGLYYISGTGKAVDATALAILTHELGHATTGTPDNDSFANLDGDNDDLTNPWYVQLGIPERATYEAVTTTVIANAEYTGGQQVQNAIVEVTNNYNTAIYDNTALGGIAFDSSSLDLGANGITGSTVVIGYSSNNSYVGTTSRDWLYGNSGDDTLDGAVGNDFIYGGGDADTLKGGDGDDEIWGGDNPLIATGQTDGDDTIDGGAGKDRIYGGAGSDTITGGAGNDEIWGGDKSVETNPTGEMDTASYAVEAQPITIRYDGSQPTVAISVKGKSSGTDTLHSIEKIVGTTGRDVINIVGEIAAGTDLTIDANGGQGPIPRDSINLSKSTVGGTVTLDSLGAGTISTGTGHTINLVGFHTALIGSAFADTITDDSSGNKEIDGGAGDDVISIAGSDGAGFLIGGAGNDTITGGSGNDVIFGGAANHDNWYSTTTYVYGNQLNGGAGNDRIYSESVFDHIDGGDGDDYISTVGGLIYADWGETIVDGGAGNDVVRINPYQAYGPNGGVTVILRADSGHDTVIGEFGQHIGDSNPFDDPIYQSVNISLVGLTTEDLELVWDVPTITPGQGYDGRGDLVVIVKSTGASILIRDVYGDCYTGVTDRFSFRGVTINGADLMYYNTDSYGSNLAWITTSSSSSYDVAEADYAAGTALPSGSTTGTTGNDEIAGGDGDDTLSGGDGNDLFIASAGEDQIDGGNGDDTFEAFGSRADFTITQLGGGVFDITDNRGILGTATLTAIENIYFVADGETYQMGDIFGYHGTSGNDTVTGSELDNELFGMDGNDVLIGGGGNDVIDGGAGTDLVKLEGANADYTFEQSIWDGSIHFTTVDEFGDPVEVSLANVEQVQFLGDGTELDIGNWTLSGTSGADILSSGAYGLNLSGLDGNDVLTGGDGSATLDGGDGDDVINLGSGYTQIEGGAGDDQVRVAGASTDYSVSWTLDGKVEIYGTAMTVEEGYAIASNIESIYFAGDDTTLLVTGLPDLGTSGNDTITGSARGEALFGQDGDDTLIGLQGNDSLYGGTGADTMTGGTGDDFYEVDDIGDVVIEASGEGRDVIYSTIDLILPNNVENLILDWLSSAVTATGNALDNSIEGNALDNILSGGGGDDQLAGYAGNDTLVGGAGSDTYIFYAGDGEDVISGETRGGTDVNTLQLGWGIAPEDVIVSLGDSGHDVVISFAGNSDTITIDEMNADAGAGIDLLQFADETVWTADDLLSMAAGPSARSGTPDFARGAGHVGSSWALNGALNFEPEIWAGGAKYDLTHHLPLPDDPSLGEMPGHFAKWGGSFGEGRPAPNAFAAYLSDIPFTDNGVSAWGETVSYETIAFQQAHSVWAATEW